jgi:hypothetical protein
VGRVTIVKTSRVALGTALLLASAASIAPAIARPPAASTVARTRWAQASPAQKQIEGKVKHVHLAMQSVTLDDGTTLTIADRLRLRELAPGAMIRAAYEERHGEKFVISLEVLRR